jgi:hypothetical protein
MLNVVILKNRPVKGLCGRCFICLRPPPLLLYDHIFPLLHKGYVYTVYLFTQERGGEGGELTKVKVRGAIVHKAG